MATLIKDTEGNVIQKLNAINGTTVIDTRQNTSTVGVLNGEVVIDISGEVYASVDVRGTFVANFNPQYTVDGSNYINLPVFNRQNETFQSFIGGPGTFQFEIPPGTKKIRLLCASYTSGVAVIAMSANIGNYMQFEKQLPSNMHGTATGVVGATCLLTLPLAFGLFHYITAIKIEKFAAAALTAGATPVLITTTNLAGSRVYSVDNSAQVAGTFIKEREDFSNPLKSVTAGTATNITAPATPNVIWRISVDYYLGA